MKSLAAALLVVLGFNSTFAQVFWTEDFSNQASSTTNWVSGGTNDGSEVWTWTDDPAAGFQNSAGTFPAFGGPTASTGYFYFNSDANGEADHAVTLTNTGAPIDCSGKTGVRLTFSSHYARYTAGAVAELGVSTNGTDFTYHTLMSDVPVSTLFEGPVSVLLPEADNQAQVWLQFRWTGNYEYHWKVDDLSLEEYVAPDNTVTFRVNAALLTVDPAGMKIAGSFTGWADADMVEGANSIWSYTATLPEGTEVLYKFKNGPNGWESGQAACGISDGFGGYNRNYTPEGDATLAAVCFNSCDVCQLPCELNPDAIICDKFDTYSTATRLGPQATWWSTWSGTEGGTEDGIVSAEQAFSPSNSLKLVSTAAAGGPQDVVLNLGNKTTGRYALNWKMYIPTGKQGYYKVQNVVPIGAGDWNLDVFFSANGAGNIQIGQGASLGSFTYPYDTWFDVEHEFDLDNNLMQISVNGVIVRRMAFAKNLGGIDFYCTNGSSLYYVDDVEYLALPAVTFNADVCDVAVDLNAYMGGAAGVVTTVGPYDITSATVADTDPTEGFECFFEETIENTHWFTFVGDGNTYKITTGAECGDSPVPLSDTQFALYTGECGSLTAVDCNDDVDAANDDYRSTLTISTTAGTVYYLMVDTYQGDDGTYCLDIEQIASITCAQGEIGVNTVGNDGFLCFGENLADIMAFDETSYTIPTQGPVAGHLWCITTEPLDPNVWPGTITGIASTGANSAVVAVGLPNDGSAFDAGVYYLTSVIVGGGTLIDPAGVARIFNIDITNGCFYVGTSHEITLLPEMDPLVGFTSTSAGTTSGNINVGVVVDGGLGGVLQDPSLYIYEWSNGATTEELVNVPSATYTVTVSDPTGCVEPITLEAVVGTNDPSTVKSLVVAPNPTKGQLNISLQLNQASEVQIEVVNAFGQVVNSFNTGNTNVVNQSVDLSAMPSGVYSLRVRMNQQTAVRRIVVQH